MVFVNYIDKIQYALKKLHFTDTTSELVSIISLWPIMDQTRG